MKLGIAVPVAVLAITFLPAGHARAGDYYTTMCEHSSGGKCLYYVNPYGQAPATGTHVDLGTEWAYRHGGPLPNAVGPVVASACGGGSVTRTCPFKDRSLDKRYLGRPIVLLPFTDLAPQPAVAGCIAAARHGLKLLVDNGCGRRSLWVEARGRWVNVSKSAREPLYLASRGSRRARLATWGRGERWVFTPCGVRQPCY